MFRLCEIGDTDEMGKRLLEADSIRDQDVVSVQSWTLGLDRRRREVRGIRVRQRESGLGR